MKASSACISLIKEFEGLRTRAYKCSAGVWTIGYGHTGPDVKEGNVITEEAANELLKIDLERFEQGVSVLLQQKNIEVNQNQFDALVSFAYNLGIGNLASSTLLRKLGLNDIQGAADEFPRWNKSLGQVLKGLTLRREAERALFLS